jgi:chemotaxis protein CheX
VGEVNALVSVSGDRGLVVLDFPEETALGVVKRVLANHLTEVPPVEELEYDCLGEMVNVVAGQAKAILADTPYRFSFSTPRVVAGVGQDIWPRNGEDGLIVVFSSDVGPFALQLLLSREAA